MFKRLLVLATLGVMLSGCFIAPVAFIGPAISGFTPGSIIQSGLTSTANYMVKKSTGKTIAQHAYDAINHDTLVQTLAPQEKKIKLATPK